MPRLDIKGYRNPDVCTDCGCGGFLTEFSEANPTFDNHISKGVILNTQGDTIRLSYNGLLAKSGAKDVYAVINYGDNKNWDDVRYYPMDQVGQRTFEVLLPINENMNLNVAFKDGANNWDNNSGKNYSFNAH